MAMQRFEWHVQWRWSMLYGNVLLQCGVFYGSVAIYLVVCGMHRVAVYITCERNHQLRRGRRDGLESEECSSPAKEEKWSGCRCGSSKWREGGGRERPLTTPLPLSHFSHRRVLTVLTKTCYWKGLISTYVTLSNVTFWKFFFFMGVIPLDTEPIFVNMNILPRKWFHPLLLYCIN